MTEINVCGYIVLDSPPQPQQDRAFSMVKGQGLLSFGSRPMAIATISAPRASCFLSQACRTADFG